MTCTLFAQKGVHLLCIRIHLQGKHANGVLFQRNIFFQIREMPCGRERICFITHSEQAEYFTEEETLIGDRTFVILAGSGIPFMIYR